MNRPTEPVHPASYQDVLDAPEGVVAELIGGALHLHPRPASPHGHAASGLGAELWMAFQRGRTGPGGWWILDEPEIHFTATDVFVPDVAGWRRETMPDFEVAPYHRIVPDWVCEVLSPRTREYDVTEKREVYARHGCGPSVVHRPRRAHAGGLRARRGVLAPDRRRARRGRGPARPVRGHRRPAGAALGARGLRRRAGGRCDPGGEALTAARGVLRLILQRRGCPRRQALRKARAETDGACPSCRPTIIPSVKPSRNRVARQPGTGPSGEGKVDKCSMIGATQRADWWWRTDRAIPDPRGRALAQGGRAAHDPGADRGRGGNSARALAGSSRRPRRCDRVAVQSSGRRRGAFDGAGSRGRPRRRCATAPSQWSDLDGSASLTRISVGPPTEADPTAVTWNRPSRVLPARRSPPDEHR